MALIHSCYALIGVIGQNRRDQNRIKNLAALIGDKKAFDSAFNKSVLSKPTPANLDSGTNLRDSQIGHPLNKIDVLLEASRTFCIGEV